MIFPRLQGPNRTLVKLVGVVITMASLSFAAVPFYDWFCRVTGFGGTTSVAEAGSDVVLDRTVKVRFDASLEQGMPWTFKPAVPSMEIRIGETGLAFYEAHNPTSRPVAGTASFNVYPYAAGGYFTKIACFCFTEQVLQPGETVQLPVSFYVDPAMVDDPEGRFVQEIVLSYTFHETPLPQDQAVLSEPAAADAAAVN
ncbi:cytochrome c oxidase assembly protein [Tabrizicola caldifontis]|uniref:cytochrome c oxidase assembly protein n=1 Tax=Tabrizicola caldifontis TaxID=2528036 RepID=UPI0010816C9E|nr:cytochrome c oxidase assembly protein [Rhodobacter sp. YIM 73028]